MRVRKNTPCVCEYCGNDFLAVKSSLGRFCSVTCSQRIKQREKLHGRTSWFNCCKCHLSVGFGLSVSARLIGKDKSRVADGVRAAGLQRFIPEGGSWRVSASIMQRKKKEWQDAWMSGYDAKFPDWSSLVPVETAKERARRYARKKHKESPKDSPYRLKKIIRSRVYNSIKRATNQKPRLKHRTIQMLGCSIETMKAHLEKQFKKGMTWENHGTHWHVDHIVPLSQFDFTNPIQAALATHYTNLQPMWASENLYKSDRITQTHQLQFL